MCPSAPAAREIRNEWKGRIVIGEVHEIGITVERASTTATDHETVETFSTSTLDRLVAPRGEFSRGNLDLAGRHIHGEPVSAASISMREPRLSAVITLMPSRLSVVIIFMVSF